MAALGSKRKAVLKEAVWGGCDVARVSQPTPGRVGDQIRRRVLLVK